MYEQFYTDFSKNWKTKSSMPVLSIVMEKDTYTYKIRKKKSNSLNLLVILQGLSLR